MSKSAFEYLGRHRGRKFQHDLSVSGRQIHSYLVRHSKSSDPSDRILLVCGKTIDPLLPKNKRDYLNSRSESVSSDPAGISNSRTVDVKRYITTLSTDPPKDIYYAYHYYGRFTAIKIDSSCGYDICATTLPLSLDVYEQIILPFYDVESETLRDLCHSFNEYFSDRLDLICDILRALFFNEDKLHSPEISHEIEAIIQSSIEKKLSMIETCTESPDSDKRDLSNYLHSEYKQYIDLYKAAISVIRSALCALSWICNLSQRKSISSACAISLRLINNLSESLRERDVLSQCIMLIANPHECESAQSDFSNNNSMPSWLKDLYESCLFISLVLSYLLKHGRDTIYIFISHHMSSIYSIHFINQLLLWSSHLYEHHHIKFMYADGDYPNIPYLILSRLWLSDYWVIYVPNDLRTYNNSPKKLKDRDDYFILELFYGCRINKPCKFITAPNCENTFSNLIEQASGFKYTTFSRHISTDKHIEYGRKIVSLLKDNMFAKHRIIHTPTRSELSPETANRIVEQIISHSIGNKLRYIISGLKLSISRDDWSILTVIADLYSNRIRKHKRSYTDVADIVHYYVSKYDSKHAAGVQSSIISCLSRLLKCNIYMCDTIIPLIKKAPGTCGYGAKYVYNLYDIVSTIQQYYDISIKHNLLHSYFIGSF